MAPIVGCSPAAARQLASRARRRVQGTEDAPEGDRSHQRDIVAVFLAPSRRGDFAALLALLDPDVSLRADAPAIAMGAAGAAGAAAVAETFSGRARAARLASVGGAAGAVWAVGGRPKVVFAFTLDGGRIIGIEMVADPDDIERLGIEVLEG